MINSETTIKELREHQILAEFFPYFIYNTAGDGAGNFNDENASLADIEKRNMTWKASDMIYGLNTLVSNKLEFNKIIYNVYSENEVHMDSEKDNVKLICFPSRIKRGEKSPWAILASGGAYGAVCSLPESFPVAARLSELGITVFCLNYRVAGGETLFPKPMEDLGAAYKYIESRADDFSIDLDRYIVGGFSAGGHLAACWGTRKLGYVNYGARKPDMLMLDYPLINVWDTVNAMPEPINTMMLSGYLGVDNNEAGCKKYNVDENVTSDYPTTFIIQAEDDPVVPFWNSKQFTQKLYSEKVKFFYLHPHSGGHGFGLGTGTEAAGWVDEAVRYWNKLI